jgi:1-acyl-sn-glycerol-3-phosphate acyltransferase
MRYIYKFTQKILLIATYFVARVMSDTKVLGKENIRHIKKGPIFIVANHKSYFDPPFIGLCFPFFSQIYPLRFMTADRFYKSPFGWLIFKAWGTFPTYRGQGLEKSLADPIRLLHEGETVIFFPEGRIYLGDDLYPPRPGAAVIASKFNQLQIIPVAMSQTHKIWPSMKHLHRQKAYIKIGSPFTLADSGVKLDDAPADIDKISQILMEKIADEYQSLPK